MAKDLKPPRGSAEELDELMQPYWQYVAEHEAKLAASYHDVFDRVASKMPTNIGQKVIVTCNPDPKSWLGGFMEVIKERQLRDKNEDKCHNDQPE